MKTDPIFEQVDKIRTGLLNSYPQQRQERLNEAINEYLDEDEHEALAAAIISHLRAEYQYCSEKCGKIKRVLDLLQTGSVQ